MTTKGRDMQLLAQWVDNETAHLTCIEPRCFHYIEIRMGEPMQMEDIVSWYNTHRFVSHDGGNLTWPSSTFSSFSQDSSASRSERSGTAVPLTSQSFPSVWD